MLSQNYNACLKAAKVEASNLVSRSNTTLPIDVCRLASLLGYSIEEAYIPWPGYLPEGKNLIIVRKTDPYVRKRFTIAHEIGHILWSKVSNEYPIRSRARYKDISFGEERIADILAADLLMPLNEFQEKLIQSIRPSLYNVVSIAKLFSVSLEACLRRITELATFVAFNYLYDLKLCNSQYDVHFNKGFSTGQRLIFVNSPTEIVRNCIQVILETDRAWEGKVHLRGEGREFHIPSIGHMITKNQQLSIRLFGWRQLF